MSEMKPDIKIRLLVASWPDDAPRGAVSAFCKQHNVSRAWFYKVRAAAVDGTWAALELGSTKPKSHPRATPQGMIDLALTVRAELEGKGVDCGPLSVHAILRRKGLTPPSRATLARLFTRAGVVAAEPRKKPRSAFRRFVYPAPNCCWQIDVTDWTLENGRVVGIFQLIDDHSRVAVASLVASGETSEAAIRVVDIAIARHGVPQKLLSDNGSALNTGRRGFKNQLMRHLEPMGVEMITGKPGKPTTQGKNERFHQTLHKYLNKRDPARTMAELQAHVDAFDTYYNTKREHQALTRLTPQEAWDATPIATPPMLPSPVTTLEAQSTQRVVKALGCVHFQGCRYQVGKEHIGQTVHIIHSVTNVGFYDQGGTEIITHARPPAGAAYVGNNKPRGFMAMDRYKVSTKP
jgi:transposase InsO family protein